MIMQGIIPCALDTAVGANATSTLRHTVAIAAPGTVGKTPIKIGQGFPHEVTRDPSRSNFPVERVRACVRSGLLTVVHGPTSPGTIPPQYYHHECLCVLSLHLRMARVTILSLRGSHVGLTSFRSRKLRWPPDSGARGPRNAGARGIPLKARPEKMTQDIWHRLMLCSRKPPIPSPKRLGRSGRG